MADKFALDRVIDDATSWIESLSMTVRIATFNAENLMHRFDFSGFKNALQRDRAINMLEVQDRQQYEALEQARVIAHTDDTMQLTALAIQLDGWLRRKLRILYVAVKDELMTLCCFNL